MTPTPTVTNTPCLVNGTPCTASPTPTPTLSPTLTPSPTTIPQGSPVIYPNPVTLAGSFNIQPYMTSTADVRVQVFTTAFRKVADLIFQQVSPGQFLNVPAKDGNGTPLANGLYYLVVNRNGTRFTLKLLVLF